MNKDNVARRTEASEGRIHHLYLCTGGKVTAGVGHAMETFEDARCFRWEIDGRPATDAELRRDYEKVAAAPVGLAARAYAALTKCRMPDDEVTRILNFDIDKFSIQVSVALNKSKGIDFSALPESIQEALFDMAYNMGVGGDKKGLLSFKKLLASVAAGDFETAATQCHRKGIAASRNEETELLFLSATKQPTTT